MTMRAAGGDLSPLPSLQIHEVDDGDRGRLRDAARQDEREKEIVPRVEETQDRRCGEARQPADRQGDLEEGLHQAWRRRSMPPLQASAAQSSK